MPSLTITPINISAAKVATTGISQKYLQNDQLRIDERYCKSICDHISNNMPAANILVVDCDSGWLAAQLSKVTLGYVIAIDADKKKIAQAKKDFGSYSNLLFREETFNAETLKEKKFDMILLTQHDRQSQDIAVLMPKVVQLLSLFGEVHIISLSFNKYLKRLVHSYRYKLLYKPSFILKWLQSGRHSFFHIAVKNSYL